MADTKISALTALAGTGVDTAVDVMAIVDTDLATTKKILASELLIALGTTSGTQASTFTFNGSGGTTASLTMTYEKTGNWIKLNIPACAVTTGTSSTSLVSNTALPAAIRPASIQRAAAVAMTDNASAIAGLGLWSVGTDGIITLFRDHTAATFTNSASAGTSNNQSIVYFIG